MLTFELLFWTSLAVVVYTYAGYPLLLSTAVRMGLRRPVVQGRDLPSVTLVISAFNEEEVIDSKLKNSLSIDYPSKRLDILVVSDASDDRTDAIVESYEPSNRVRLLRMQQRSGKTDGLNKAVELCSADLLVFSDANAMYEPDAIAMLVRNFADAEVGAVIGESRYLASKEDAGRSESAYWDYEIALKRLESSLGSVVGGDGAIYAIRRELYRQMPSDALSDFVNPCQIVEGGLLCIYEPSAICYEEAAGSFKKEFARKVRIVNRAWRATMSMKSMMNPLRHGFFSIQLLSHKLLRWLVPVFLLFIFMSSLALSLHHWFYALALTAQIAFYGVSAAGHALHRRKGSMPRVFYIPFYFCLVNVASARGIIQAYSGKTYTTWSTART